jgi:diguanylate cyclase (GGDEF)-like protein
MMMGQLMAAGGYGLGATCIGSALGSVNFLLLCNDEFNTRLLTLVATDPLTGIANRRKLIERGEEEIARIQRSEQPLTMIMMDLDHFKRINDSHGHATGDRVLIQVAQACVGALRDIDLVARSGGEEFAILLPDTPLAQGLEVAQRLRQALARVEVLAGRHKVTVTASLGVAEFHPADGSIDHLMARADRAMYRSKAGGRDQVSHQPADPTAMLPAETPA